LSYEWSAPVIHEIEDIFQARRYKHKNAMNF